ncbi:TPA: integrase domain-containing protein, partial [Morganella morganii]
WAVDAVDFHTRNGMSEKEVSAMVSMDLGHGDGRGRYVMRVYTKSSES